MQTLPKVGDKASVAGISFPLTVEGVDTNTRFAYLSGEHPETGIEVQLPRVCLDELSPEKAASEPATVLGIGQFARLKSGGPAMTIVELKMPGPNEPAETTPEVVCWHFRANGDLVIMEVDVRALSIATTLCQLPR